MTFKDHSLAKHTNYATANLFFRFVFKLSGFVNVALILTTRPNVLLFGSRGLLAPNDPRYVHEQGGGIEPEDGRSGVPMTPVGGPSTDYALGNRSPFKTEC
jgi:hypothetical protein